MKKLLAFSLAALVVQAQAATLNWGLGADIYLMKTGDDYSTAKIAYESDLKVDSGAYLALVYLGQGVDTFDIGSITADVVLDTASYALDTDNATYADFDPPQITKIIAATTYGDGASFGVVWFNGKNFDYVYSIDDGSALNQGTTVADMTRGNEYVMPAAMTTGYGGVLTVPEPSTAALALAGLALLLKRRKA